MIFISTREIMSSRGSQIAMPVQGRNVTPLFLPLYSHVTVALCYRRVLNAFNKDILSDLFCRLLDRTHSSTIPYKASTCLFDLSHLYNISRPRKFLCPRSKFRERLESRWNRVGSTLSPSVRCICYAVLDAVVDFSKE